MHFVGQMSVGQMLFRPEDTELQILLSKVRNYQKYANDSQPERFSPEISIF